MNQFPGRSYWQINTLCNEKSDISLEMPKTVNTIIIGGGIMGISTAYWLSKYGMDVLLLEKGDLAQAASGQNAGIVTFGPEEEYIYAVKNIGREKTKKILEDTIENQHILEKLIIDEELKIEYIKTGFMSLACSDRQMSILDKSANMMSIDGLDVAIVDHRQAEKLLGIRLNHRYIGGAYSSPDALLNPVAYTYEMGRIAQKYGAKIFKGESVKSIYYKNGYWYAVLSKGIVKTDNIILATGYSTNTLTEDLKHSISFARESMLSAQVTKGLFEMKLGWAGNNVSEYGRQDKNGSVLLGGFLRNYVLETKTLYRIQALLNSFVQKSFNEITLEVMNVWTGVICDSNDHVPLVGVYPGKKGLWFITAFGGQGLAFSQVMPYLLSKAIAHNDLTFLPFYATPSRFENKE